MCAAFTAEELTRIGFSSIRGDRNRALDARKFWISLVYH